MYGSPIIRLGCYICSLYIFSAIAIDAKTVTAGPSTINYICNQNGNIYLSDIVATHNFSNTSGPAYNDGVIMSSSSTPPNAYSSSYHLTTTSRTTTQQLSTTVGPAYQPSDLPKTLYIHIVRKWGTASATFETHSFTIDCEPEPEPEPCVPYSFSRSMRNSTENVVTYTLTISTQDGQHTFPIVTPPGQYAEFNFTANTEEALRLPNGDCRQFSAVIVDNFGNEYYNSTGGGGNPADLSSIYDSISSIWNKLEECPICDVSQDVSALQAQIDALQVTTQEHISNSGIHWNQFNFNQLKNYLDATYAKISDLQGGAGDMSDVAQALAQLANAVSAQAVSNVQANTMITGNQSIQIAQNQLSLDKLDSIKSKIDISNNNLSNIDSTLTSISALIENGNSDNPNPLDEEMIEELINNRMAADANANAAQAVLHDIADNTRETKEAVDSVKTAELKTKDVNSDDILAVLNNTLTNNRQLQDESNAKIDGVIEAIGEQQPVDNDLLRQIKDNTAKTAEITDMLEGDPENEDSYYGKVWKGYEAWLEKKLGSDRESVYNAKINEKMQTDYADLQVPDIDSLPIDVPSYSRPNAVITIGGHQFSTDFFSSIMFTAPWVRQFLVLSSTLLFLVWAFGAINSSYHSIITTSPVYALQGLENNIPFFGIAKSKIAVVAIATALATAPIVLSAILNSWLPYKDTAQAFFGASSVVGNAYSLVSQFIPIQHFIVLIINKLSFYPLLWLAVWAYVMLVKLSAI